MSLLINRRHWRSQSSDHRNHPRFRKGLFVKLYTHFYVHNSKSWIGAGVSWSFCCPQRVCLAYHEKKSTKNSATQNSTTKTISGVYYVTCLPRKTHLKGPHLEFSAIFFFAVHWPVGGPWLSVATSEGGGPRFGCRCTYRKLQAE